MNKALASISEWFFAPVSVYPLVVARIGLGATMFLAYIHYSPHLETLLGDDGLLIYLSGKTSHLQPNNFYWFIFAILLASALSFTLGFFTRTSGVILFLCHRYFIPLAGHFSWGWSHVINALIIYTAFSQAGLYYSFDHHRKKKKEPSFEFTGETPAWTFRLMQIHICMIYIAASWHRYDNPEWLQGEKVFVAATLPVFARFLEVNWMPFKSLFEVASHIACLVEMLAPLMLWFKRVGPWFAIFLMLMHIGIEVTSMVGWWSYMMCFVLVVFVPANFSKNLLEKFFSWSSSSPVTNAQ